MKKTLKTALALLLVLLLGMTSIGGAGMTASAAEPTPVSVSIGADELTLQKGETRQLSAVVVYSDYTTGTITALAQWTSDNTECVTVTGSGLVTALKVTNEPVTVSAKYTQDGVTLEASCKVTVVVTVPAERIIWNWPVNALIAGTDKVYSFDKTSGLYSIIPENADAPSVSLSCTPDFALEIDNEKKTFKVNPLTDRETLAVTLTLTADGAGAHCLPASKTMTIYRGDLLNIIGVRWKRENETATTWLRCFEKPEGAVGVYYFMPTALGNPDADYAFELVFQPLYYEGKAGAGGTDDLETQILKQSDIEVTSSDKRVIAVDMPTGRLIPVGNGTADLTVTVTLPNGKSCSDTMTAGVYDSPYTPITDVHIASADESIVCETGADEMPKISLVFGHDYLLTAKLNDGATLLNETTDIMLDDGRVLKTVRKCDFKWTSSDENVVTVSTNRDGTASIRASGVGDAAVTLTINDNGKMIVSQIKVHARMTWQEALVGFFTSLFAFSWGKTAMYSRAFWAAVRDAFKGTHC